MNRSSVLSTRIITAALAFAMLGLVVAQALLVRNSLELSDQLFRQQVQESLSTVARKLEDAEHVADAVTIAAAQHAVDEQNASAAEIPNRKATIAAGRDARKECEAEQKRQLDAVNRAQKAHNAQLANQTGRQLRVPVGIEALNRAANEARVWDSVFRQMSGGLDVAFSSVEQELEQALRTMGSRRFVFDVPSVDPFPEQAPEVQVTIGIGGTSVNLGGNGSADRPMLYGKESSYSVSVGNPASMRFGRRFTTNAATANARPDVILIQEQAANQAANQAPNQAANQVPDRAAQQSAYLNTEAVSSAKRNPSQSSDADCDGAYNVRARNKMLNIRQTVRDLREFTRNLGDRVSARVVDSVLLLEFSGRNLPTDYVFGIRDGRSAQFICTKNGVQPDAAESAYSTVLFPGDIVPKNHTLHVSFPGKREYLMNKNAAILSSSAVFMAIIVGSFGWTMRNLNRHKKISEMKSDFISNMTHELKTPIATIELAADALRDPDVSASADRVQRFLGVIREENHRLRSQVERVLQAAKMERGELILNTSPIDIHDIIEESADAIKLQLESRGGELHTDLRADSRVVSGDEMHLRNVVLNLLDNAIKYSTDAPFISVSTVNTGTHVRIDVTDRGIGISRENQKRVFERLYRVPTGNVHNVKGFGLGLSYVQAIAEAHGGTVSVQSEVGTGSTFSVILPCMSVA
ncbi:MAG: ATP-binding protein [Candidatus Kapaibacterium sp.]